MSPNTRNAYLPVDSNIESKNSKSKWCCSDVRGWREWHTAHCEGDVAEIASEFAGVELDLRQPSKKSWGDAYASHARKQRIKVKAWTETMMKEWKYVIKRDWGQKEKLSNMHKSYYWWRLWGHIGIQLLRTTISIVARKKLYLLWGVVRL